MTEERSKIEDMKRRLYVREADPSPLRRQNLRDRSADVPEGWQESPNLEKFSGPPKRTTPLINKIFLFSVLFFIVAIGISFFFFFGNSSSVSSNNISVVIQAPNTIGGGEILPLQIAVRNNNAVPLELADLVVEFPDGTRFADDLATPLPRLRESLGTISSGESVNKTVRAVLFGEENKPADIKITVEYRLAGSNAIFYKETNYSILLSSAPLRLSVQTLKETVSGQPLDFVVTVESNSTEVLKKILLTAEYPAGLTFKSADPKPSFGNSSWSLGDIPVKGHRTITIHGVLSGQDNEERVVRFSAGVGSDTDEKTLATAFVTNTETIVIKRPFLAADVALNGSNAAEIVAARGRVIRADVSYINNSPTTITNAQIAIVLSPEALDKASVSPEHGFYRSLDSTVLWDQTMAPELAAIPPGGSGTFSFTFAPKKLSEGNLKNATIALTVNVSGTRSGENNVPEKITSTASRQIHIASDLLLAAQAAYGSGPFPNTGPLPPKVEKETTYTIIWTLTNSSNNVSNVSVVGTLPAYVRYVGKSNPATFNRGESLTFNPIGGTVTWAVDSLPAGVGYGSSPKEASFQIAFTPSVSQIGTPPILINGATVQGFDQFSQVQIGDTRPALTTMLGSDPTFRPEQGVVVE